MEIGQRHLTKDFVKYFLYGINIIVRIGPGTILVAPTPPTLPVAQLIAVYHGTKSQSLLLQKHFSAVEIPASGIAVPV